LELFLLLLTLLFLGELLFVLLFSLSLKEWQVSIDDIEQEIAKRDKIVSSALSQQAERILTREDDVALKGSVFLTRDMLTVLVLESLSKTEINQSNFVQRSSMVRKFNSVTDTDVVELEVIVKKARLVDQLDGLENLDANLQASLIGEGFVPLEEVVFKSFAELVLDDVRPHLFLNFGNHFLFLSLWILRRFLDSFSGDECRVSDEALSLCVSFRE
jgi:hypothetical protein